MCRSVNLDTGCQQLAIVKQRVRVCAIQTMHNEHGTENNDLNAIRPIKIGLVQILSIKRKVMEKSIS